jgi:hypothetical protein
MADNIPITPGSGATVATEDMTYWASGQIGGHLQRMKIVTGDANIDGGDASTNFPLVVTDPAPRNPDSPIFASITGSPFGDFAGVNILEQVVTDGTGLAFNTKLSNVNLDPSGNVGVNIQGASTVAVSSVSGTVTVAGSVSISGSTGPIQIAGSNGGAIATDANNRLAVVGIRGLGTSNTVSPVMVGATTPSGTVANIQTDASGNIITVGPAATGAAATANPVQIGGTDGTNVRTISTDTSGRPNVNINGTPTVSISGTPAVTVTSGTITVGNSSLTVVGAAASGAAAAGNPVLMAGSDGSNARTLRTDTSGNLDVNIQGTPAVTVSSGTVTVSGTVAVSALSGTVTVIGDAASGSAVAGNPVLIAGSDGTNARSIKTDTSGNVAVNVQNSVAVSSVSGTVNIASGTGTAISTDASGHLFVVGSRGAGQSINTSPVLVGGQTPGNLVAILQTDASGNQIAVGPVAVGSVITQNPVVIGGVLPSGMVSYFNLDSNGNQIVAGEVSSNGGPWTGQAVAAQDVSQYEGQSFIEIMSQILNELRVLNYQIHQLPLVLNSGIPSIDDPMRLAREYGLQATNGVN